ncbi:MAG: hypothetical protein ACKOSS_05315 [Planctomycetia bacterium]
MLVEYFEESVAREGERTTVLHMRKFASTYLAGFPGARRLRDQIQRIDSSAAFYGLVAQVFAEGAPQPLVPDHERLRRAGEAGDEDGPSQGLPAGEG